MSGIDTPIRMGPVAAEILRHDGEVDVAAVFERCFYVAAPRGFVCIGVDEIGDGPLNVLLRSETGNSAWSALGITREAKGAIAAGRLSIGADYVLSLVRVAVWSPPDWPRASRTDLVQNLDALRRLAAPLCPAEGLSQLVLGRPNAADRTARAAKESVTELAGALKASLAGGRATPALVRSATLLLGLGPGLTPSGDDLLGGVFLVLSALDQTTLRDDLWAALEPELDALTVGISGAHLAAAADGLGAAGVHATLSALLGGDMATLPGHLRDLGRIGHSSGFDTLAGLLIACEAALAAGLPSSLAG